MPRPPRRPDGSIAQPRDCSPDVTEPTDSQTQDTEAGLESPEEQTTQPSPLSNLWGVWSLIIRPGRSQYAISRLGPNKFMAGERHCVRRDWKIKTTRGVFLECSFFRARDENAARCAPVVVYLHGNSGSRVEALDLVVPFLRRGISLFTYDAGGCGLSDGDYISLGWHESEDLKEVLIELQRGSEALGPPCGPIALWGRSMGAVTALLHTARQETHSSLSLARVVVMCLDSPFASLRQVASEHAQSERFRKMAGFNCSGLVFEAAFAIVRMRVQALANFDMEKVSPLTSAPQCLIPALFVHGNADNFVAPSHSRQLYDVYGGAMKQFAEVEGSHNSVRNAAAQQDMVNFVVSVLVSQVSQIQPPAAPGRNRPLPPRRGLRDKPIPPPSLIDEPPLSPRPLPPPRLIGEPPLSPHDSPECDPALLIDGSFDVAQTVHDQLAFLDEDAKGLPFKGTIYRM